MDNYSRLKEVVMWLIIAFIWWVAVAWLTYTLAKSKFEGEGV